MALIFPDLILSRFKSDAIHQTLNYAITAETGSFLEMSAAHPLISHLGSDSYSIKHINKKVACRPGNKCS